MSMSMSTGPTPNLTPVALSSAAAESGFAAYQRVEPELAALPVGELQHINVDIPRACSISFSAMPSIQALVVEVKAKLPDHPVDAMVKLSDYTAAAYHAHLMASPDARDSALIEKLAEEGAPLREHLFIQADALAHAGLMPQEKVDANRAGTGYMDLANDLSHLSILFRDSWSKVEGKTTVTPADFERAVVLGRELLTAIGTRVLPDGAAITQTEAADRRARAFTLFARAYDECRRAAIYLRWHEGDWDKLVPSIFTRSRKRAASEEAIETPPATETSPAAPPAAPVNGTD